MKKVILIILLMYPFFVFAKTDIVAYEKCIDGDTIKVKRNKETITVRMLAVNTPELEKENKEREYYAKEASDYTCNLIKNAKEIKLEYDEKSNEKDKYDRVLAWVYVDGYLLNDSLVRNGYAKVDYVYDDYKYVNLLKEHENLAKKENLGIWNENTETENILVWTGIFTAILLSLFAMINKKLKNNSK